MQKFIQLHTALKQLQNKSRFLPLVKPRKQILNGSRQIRIRSLNLGTASFLLASSKTSLMFGDAKATHMGFQTKLWNLKSKANLIKSKRWNTFELVKKMNNTYLQPQPFLEKNELNKNSSFNVLLQKNLYKQFNAKALFVRKFTKDPSLFVYNQWHQTLPRYALERHLHYVFPVVTKEPKTDQPNTTQDLHISTQLINALQPTLFDADLLKLGIDANPVVSVELTANVIDIRQSIDDMLLNQIFNSEITDVVFINPESILPALQHAQLIKLFLLMLCYGSS